MAQQLIVTTPPGTAAPTAGTMINANFSELYGPVPQVLVPASTTLALTFAAHHGATIILAATGATVSINATTLGLGFVCKIINDTGAVWTLPTPTDATYRFDGATQTAVIVWGSVCFEIYENLTNRLIHCTGATQ